MSQPLSIALLWHMHQPYYVNPVERTAVMPWVRLHAVKGYLDMLEMAGRYPDLRMSFNFTPVLVRQLRELSEGTVRDAWEELARKPAAELDPTERERVLEHFFKIHWGNLIEPFPRYRELLEMRGRDFNPQSLRDAVRLMTDQDFRDLQTWFNLNWCGFSAFRRYPELGELRARGRDFTEEEKNRVLDIHREIVAAIVPLYRRAQDEGRIELTTTPYFHPIMPLVYDTDIASRAMPGRTLPPRFQAPEDVRAHLRMAQEEHERAFGRRARGMWPSEGSVAPEILPLMAEAGIEYFCTDEDILFRSLEAEGRQEDHLELFQVWRCVQGEAAVKALFRERPLSDFIGFNAARNQAEDAASYLVHHLEHIAGVVKAPRPVVLLALDGENAWEAFHDGGELFLSRFYEGLLGSGRLSTATLAQAVERAGDHFPTVNRLHSGSWIGGNFDIWIGDPEENAAWEWLGKTRAFLVRYLEQHPVDEAVARAAWEEIYAAEGSDWFWWYGPDFHTDCDMLFDELFRRHLQNVYRVLGLQAPEYLEVPIRQRGRKSVFTRPTQLITPRIDGRAGGFFDWLGAGRLEARQQLTAMFQSDRMLQDLFYGFDEKRFYLRLDFEQKDPEEVRVVFCRPGHRRLKLFPHQPAVGEYSEDGVDFAAVEESGMQVAWQERLEVGIPWEFLGSQFKDECVAFFVQIWCRGVEQERYPERGLIECEGPGPEFVRQHWYV